MDHMEFLGSTAVYTGLVVTVLGCASLLRPLTFLGMASRLQGAVVNNPEGNNEYRPQLRPFIQHGPEIKVIYLQWSDVSAGLILKAKTGIAYSQQAGGYGGYQPLEEGALFRGRWMRR